MRDTDGNTPMPDDLWEFVLARFSDLRPELAQHAAYAEFEVAHEWKGVTRMIHFRAQREAARVRKTLFYAQACDRTEKGGGIPPEIAHAALGNMNVNKTGGVPSMFVWHLGMRMRLKIKLSATRKIMQDATGVVVGFDVLRPGKPRSSIFACEFLT